MHISSTGLLKVEATLRNYQWQRKVNVIQPNRHYRKFGDADISFVVHQLANHAGPHLLLVVPSAKRFHWIQNLHRKIHHSAELYHQ